MNTDTKPNPWLWLVPKLLCAMFFFTLLFAKGSAHAQSAGSTSSASMTSPLVIPTGVPLVLIQPLDDTTTMLPPSNGINAIFLYFNLSWPWLLGVAAGIAVLQGIVAGVEIMAGGSPDKIEAGKTRFMWALAGMLILGLAGVILRILNPTFYT